jgi:hypothetical protein
MFIKNFRLPLTDRRDQLLEQLETELAVGWTNVSHPIDRKGMILKKLVELVQDTMDEEETKKDYL